MQKVFAAIAITAIAMAGTAAVAETAAEVKHAEVQAQWAALDTQDSAKTPISGLFDLIAAPAKALSNATK